MYVLGEPLGVGGRWSDSLTRPGLPKDEEWSINWKTTNSKTTNWKTTNSKTTNWKTTNSVTRSG